MKKRTIGVVIFIIGVIVIIIGVLLLNNGNTKKQVVPEEVEKEDITVEKEENNDKNSSTNSGEQNNDIVNNIELMSPIIFKKEKSSLNASDLSGEELVWILVNLSDEKVTDVTGSRLKEIAHNNFGIDNVQFVDLACGVEDSKKPEHVLYIYNKDIDKYESNPKHGGHGIGHNGVYYNLVDGKTGSEGDFYTYTAGIYYYFDGCTSDVCGPFTYMDIYLTYDDALNKTNKIMNAVENNDYCEKLDYGYNCDSSKIYKGINNPKKVTFYYKKVNDNYVFVKYVIN